MTARKHDERGLSRGFALIVVLWFLVLIAAVSTYLLANARSETAVARNIRSAAAAEALADAGVAQAVFNQTDGIIARRWKPDGEPHLIRMLDGEATIRLYDENAKINPNLASRALVTSLFEAVGVDRSLAMRLGAAIAERAAGAAAPKTGAAGDEQGQAAGRGAGARRAAFESLDELQLVGGMSPTILALVLPYLTIYTSDDEPSAKLLSPVVRRAVALAARAGTEPQMETGAASPAKSNQVELGPDDPDRVVPVEAAAEQADAQSPSDILSLKITAREPGGGVFVRNAVVRIDPRNLKGYVVLDWRRGALAEDS